MANPDERLEQLYALIASRPPVTLSVLQQVVGGLITSIVLAFAIWFAIQADTKAKITEHEKHPHGEVVTKSAFETQFQGHIDRHDNRLREVDRRLDRLDRHTEDTSLHHKHGDN